MAAKLGYGGVDRFRLAAALLVVANHTGPLSSYSLTADFLLSGVLARLANAFFFMVSGYFLFGRPRDDRRQERAALGRFLSRIGLFYAAGMLLYLPLNVYDGYFASGKGVLSYAEDIAFNGTMYHLWYLPAVMLGMCIVYGLRGVLSDRWTLGASAFLYALGLLGDSYYGLTAKAGVLSSFYDVLFEGFHYTRNGLFFAPLYIALGALAARRPLRPGFVRGYAGMLLISSGLLLAEGKALHEAGWPRHDSMYAAMVPAAYFLFRLLLAWGGAERRLLRPICAWMYVLHPLAIVLLRGIAEATGLVPFLIRNSLVYFLSVSVLSALLSMAVVCLDRLRKRRRKTGNIPSRAWAEIDLGHLEHNIGALGSLLPGGTQMMAVVKADAYGHGGVPIAKRLYKAGVRFFAVAEVDEGIALRRGGLRGDILVLGYTPSHRLTDLVRFKLMQTVVSADDAERLQASGHRLAVHVKIDTGMNRLGEPSGRIERVLSMYRHSRLRVAGTFSHLAAADGTEPEAVAFTRGQIDRFLRAVAEVRAAGFDPGPVHLQSSYGILNYPELRFDLVRPGIALYGLLANERDKKAAGIDLRPVLALKATVTRVETVRAGEHVGYGMSYAASRDSVVATVSIGYADGVPRELSERGGCVLVRGRRAPIVGRICMDQMMADVTGIGEVRPGDTVTLIGADGDECITAEEVAGWTGTISNETVTSIGARVARRYV
ncbi:serine racemase VanT catalytic subunit [Cohnella zeiphila]|uniref:Alanine racemase n=1 Tax=Cohnella zeiphila TaxID=2761120 RepID=A0A7X0SKY1_9BACL|nr:serine racemase VanT catalytic subunit [Cohnella zeiphila]MBB6731794.1 serine racemase VanT catalytic subunit [Cohnella zeiphila]